MNGKLDSFFRTSQAKELLPSLKAIPRLELDRLSSLNYPFHFQILVKGGWINKSGSWFLPNFTANYDSTVRSSLVNFKGGDIYPYAYAEGFVLQGVNQPSLTRFDTRPSTLKFVEFTFRKGSVCRLSYEKIKNIARLYSALLPKTRFRINYVDCNHYSISNIVKKDFMSLPFFLMEINKIKNEGLTDV